jgi:hypothetical protein
VSWQQNKATRQEQKAVLELLATGLVGILAHEYKSSTIVQAGVAAVVGPGLLGLGILVTAINVSSLERGVCLAWHVGWFDEAKGLPHLTRGGFCGHVIGEEPTTGSGTVWDTAFGIHYPCPDWSLARQNHVGCA